MQIDLQISKDREKILKIRDEKKNLVEKVSAHYNY